MKPLLWYDPEPPWDCGCLKCRARRILRWLLYPVGERLLCAAIWCLPAESSERAGLLRGLAEQRDYDRYAAFASLCCEKPLPFDKWREVRSTFRLRRPTDTALKLEIRIRRCEQRAARIERALEILHGRDDLADLDGDLARPRLVKTRAAR